MEMQGKTQEGIKKVEVDSLVRIAIFMEGFKLGNGGNIKPLGTYDLEQLWLAVDYFNRKKD